MTKSQKLKISIKLELPQPSKADDTQCVHISVPPPPYSISSRPPLSTPTLSFVNPSRGSACPFLSSDSGERSCIHYTHYHQGPLPEGCGSSTYHDRCTTSRCHYYGRCPKSRSRSRSRSRDRSRDRSRPQSPQPNVANVSASECCSYQGCPGSDSGDVRNSSPKGFETPADKQRESDQDSSDAFEELVKDTV